MAAIRRYDRTRIEPQAIAARAVHAAGEAGCHWLVPVIEMAAVAGGEWGWRPDSAPFRWTCFPRLARPTPGVNATLVRAARHFTVLTLQRWGVAGRCDDIAIVVSELLTNAIRHTLARSGATPAGGPVQLGLLQPGNCVVCAVADPSKTLPVARQPDERAENGRGLHVIAALSDQWGYITPDGRGKVSWAMFSAGITLPGRCCSPQGRQIRSPAAGRR